MKIRSIALAAATCVACTPVFADPLLPDAIVRIGDSTLGPAGVNAGGFSAPSQGATETQFGTISASTSGTSGGSAQSTLTVSSSPSVTASVQLQGDGTAIGEGAMRGGASGGVSYYFEVTSPQNRTAKLDVTAMGGISVTGAVGNPGDSARSFLTIDPFQTAVANGLTLVLGQSESVGLFSSPMTSTTWSATDQGFIVNTNQIYTVTLSVILNANVIVGQNAFLTAFVDPTFNIDPTNANADQLQLFFSPNIGAAAVPGPTVGAGLPGLAMGFTALFGWWRRKRQARLPA